MSPEGSEIRCSARRDGDDALITISDNGPGLPPERQADPFGRFGYSSAAGSGDGRGSGLGLAYVAAVARKHKGMAAYSANPAGGAVFSIRLPLEHYPDLPPAQEDEEEERA